MNNFSFKWTHNKSNLFQRAFLAAHEVSIMGKGWHCFICIMFSGWASLFLHRGQTVTHVSDKSRAAEMLVKPDVVQT